MRTLLSQFCEEFEGTVRPILDPLQRAAGALSHSPSALAARAVLPDLMELRHQLQALTDKVAQQQAYALIFGPLKSGKSTLMNAMSSAYVSEVTCLPAYPCMVNVSHSDTPQYELESYDGTKRSLSDPAALRREIAQAHAELAEHIRGRADDGTDFDPAVHWPRAIRKVDVKVPAGSLKRSGAVLVDTPGLYSRMKFGYDRMTRDFRNAAACAIFVVKTDNLFLEQVFDEFVELLELFSRIFLVVNLDSTKRDLRPDGTLVPSLEHEAPERVIEAFENLTMSAPLKRAVDDGRLGIYPVDLLQAASNRLSGVSSDPAFDAFLADLTGYLNSSDYMVAFLGDSLRRARSLFDEIGGVCKDASIERLAREVTELRSGLALAREQAQTLSRLARFEWSESLGSLRADLAEGSRAPSERTRRDVSAAVAAASERWFEGDASLQALLSGSLEELFTSSRRELSESIRSILGDRVRLGSAGLAVSDDLIRDLHSAGVSLDRLGRAAVAGLEPDSGEVGAPLSIRLEELPVKKTPWDWLLFRSQASVRRRIFGPGAAPTNPIPSAVKARRLGPEVRAALQRQLDGYLEASFARDIERVSQRLFESYSGAVTTALAEELEGRQRSNAQRMREFETRLEVLERVAVAIDDLGLEAERVSSDLNALDQRYGETPSDLLIQPAPRPAPASPAPEPQHRVPAPEGKPSLTAGDDDLRAQ